MSYDDLLEYDFYDKSELSILLKEGEGTFRVNQVIPKVSKAGNKMFEVMFMVTDSAGKEMPVYDYLIATPGDEAGMKRLNTKIMNIGKAINKPHIHAKGYKLKPNDLLGEKGKCMIKTQADKTGQYLDKSVISKYISAVDEPAGEIPDDELTF